MNDYIPSLPETQDGKPQKPTKEDTDLVAAALGLRASAWAQAVVHLVEPEINFAINGEQVKRRAAQGGAE